MTDEIRKLTDECEALGSLYIGAAIVRGQSQAHPERPSDAATVERVVWRKFIDSGLRLADGGQHTLAAEITDRALREAGAAASEAMKAELDTLRRTA